MFFTQEDYRKIEKWLLSNSRKDTDFVGAATPLKGNETLAFVQDGKNVNVFLKDLIEQIFLLGVSDFLNVTDKYGESRISLTQAIQLIPFRSRKIGQVITFLDEEGHWKLYQFQGKSLNQWNNSTLWVDLLAKISGIPIIDSEDIITKVDDAKQVSLYLADKQYNEADYSGLGRVYLRKNIQTIIDPSTGKVINANLLTQSMLAKENTIYILQYDYNLNNQTITIPSGCVLLFEGGSISDGKIKGKIRIINEEKSNIFDLITFDLLLDYSYPEWFGAKGDGVTDDSKFIQQAIDSSNMVKLSNTTYCIRNIDIHSNFVLTGDSPNSTLKCLDYSGIRQLKHFTCIGFRSSNYNYNDLGSFNKESGTFENIEIYNLTIEGSRKEGHFYLYNLMGCWLNGGTLRNVKVHDCKFYDNANASLIFNSINNSSIIEDIIIDSCEFVCRTNVKEEHLDMGDGNTRTWVGDGVLFYNEGGPLGHFNISNIKVTNCYGESLRTLADYKRGCKGGIIHNCKTKNIHDCDHSVDGSEDISISDCDCYADSDFYPILGQNVGNYSTNALELAGTNIRVNNVAITANNKMGDGIFITNYDGQVTEGIIINNCTIKDVVHQGIRALIVNKLSIKNNFIDNYNYHGISISGGSDNIAIENNSIYSKQYITHILVGKSTDRTIVPNIFVLGNTFNSYPALISGESNFGGADSGINRIHTNNGEIINSNSETKLYRNFFKNKFQLGTLPYGETYPNISDYSLKVGDTDALSYQIDNIKYFGVKGNGLYLSVFSRGTGYLTAMFQVWSESGGWLKNIMKNVVLSDTWDQYIIFLDFKELPEGASYISIALRAGPSQQQEICYPQVSNDYISRIDNFKVLNFSIDYTTSPRIGTTENTPVFNSAIYNRGIPYYDYEKGQQFIWGGYEWLNPDGTLTSKVVII
nr:MAG TPA: Poly(beta-D-mannuronate) C5 epimerase 6 [Crassvirales sp.]